MNLQDVLAAMVELDDTDLDRLSAELGHEQERRGIITGR